MLFANLSVKTFLVLTLCWALVASSPCKKRKRYQRDDFETLTRNLFEKDKNSAMVPFRCNVGNTYAQELIGPVNSNYPTMLKLQDLLEGYDEKNYNKIIPASNRLVDEIAETDVMKELEVYLEDIGILKDEVDLKSKLKEIWFSSFRRNYRDTSGFKHVFYGELFDKEIGGLHNWVSFSRRQKAPDGLFAYDSCNRINFNNKGGIVSMKGLTRGSDSVSEKTLFVGTSPELEMALYTACFLVNPDQLCHVPVSQGSSFNIQTHSKILTKKGKSKRVVGHAYPVL